MFGKITMYVVLVCTFSCQRSDNDAVLKFASPNADGLEKSRHGGGHIRETMRGVVEEVVG